MVKALRQWVPQATKVLASPEHRVSLPVMPHRYAPEDPLHPEQLKAKQRRLRDSFPLPLTLRVHRSLSWLRRAEDEHEDLDVRFILLWIGFNAAYAGDLDRALAEKNTAVVLSILFDRLYVLRNQVIHGGATWDSSANRNQVRDGAALLGCLLPVFVDLMMDHPDAEWAMPMYPVVEG